MSARRTTRSALRRSALSLAVGMVLASGAHAQQTAGSIFGKADPGDVIVIENPETGFKREIPVSSDGSFRASQTPSGTYVVTAKKADGSMVKTENFVVSVGTGTAVNFAGMATLEAIEVVGNRVNPIDVSSVESATVLTADQIDAIAVPRNVTAEARTRPSSSRARGSGSSSPRRRRSSPC